MAKSISNLFKVEWPTGGYNRGVSFDNQARDTTWDCQNVRPWDPKTGRQRGAQRAGLTRYLAAQAGGGSNVIRDISQIVLSGGSPSATSASSRTVTALAVAGGVLYSFDGASFTSKGSVLSSSVPAIFSAQLGNNMFYVDGSNYVKYDGGAGTAGTWTASTAGTLPDSGGNKARLIELWGGRIVLSGVQGDRQNYFMSAIFDAEDFSYNPNPTLETQAVAGNNGPAGRPGDIINGMVPYSDDVLIFLCDHSVWELRGNPLAGGRIDLVTDVVGGAWGRAWAKTDTGVVYFFGSRGGVYRMTPGSMPERITRDRIDEQLATVNLDTTLVRLAWDDRTQGLHVFLSPLAAGAATHWFWDMRTDSWWPDVFASTDMNPLAVHLFDGDDSDDRVLMLGGRDGRIRYVDLNNPDDDTSAIDSHIFLGPVRMSHRQRIVVDEVQVGLGSGSDGVTLTYHRGEDAESASGASAIHTRTVSAGRNYSFRDRLAGQSVFFKLRNNTIGQDWSLEYLIARMEGYTGPAQRIF